MEFYRQLHVQSRVVHESGMDIQDACLANLGGDFRGEDLLEVMRSDKWREIIL